jgi:hypothetical protein
MLTALVSHTSEIVGGGVLAAWTPTASATSGTMSAATVEAQLVDSNGTTFTTGVNNLLPGDYLNRYLDLTNTGTVAQTFTGTVAGTGTLAGALTVAADACSVSWSANGSCSGTVTSIKSPALTNAPVALSLASMNQNEVKHLRLQFKLDANASQSTYQGTSATQQVTIAGSTTVAGGRDRTAG